MESAGCCLTKACLEFNGCKKLRTRTDRSSVRPELTGVSSQTRNRKEHPAAESSWLETLLPQWLKFLGELPGAKSFCSCSAALLPGGSPREVGLG